MFKCILKSGMATSLFLEIESVYMNLMHFNEPAFSDTTRCRGQGNDNFCVVQNRTLNDFPAYKIQRPVMYEGAAQRAKEDRNLVITKLLAA